MDGHEVHISAEAYANLDRLVAAYEDVNVRLHRAEWGRFIIVCAMVLTVIAEFVGVLFTRSRLAGGLPWWIIATFILEAVMLNLATRAVNQIRTIAFDLWKACFDARFAMVVRG